MKGFVISWFYPPINSSEGLVTFKLLNRSKIRHDVFTQSNNVFWSYEKEHSLKSPRIKTIPGDSRSFDKWVDSCVKYFDEHAEEYDFVMSRSMPPESHAAAQIIKQRHPEIKWIASFGDPIYSSPYDRLFNQRKSIDYPVYTAKGYIMRYLKKPVKLGLRYYQTRGDRNHREKLKDLEEETFKNADLIIFNNSYQRDFMSDLHSNLSFKSVVLSHSYEKDLYDKKIKSPRGNKKFEIIHTGHLDGLRTPLPVLRAINLIKEQRPDLYKNIRVSFYGTFDGNSKIYIFDHELFDVVKVCKPTDYRESLRIVQNSDLALVIDANFSKVIENNIYFAAKIVDYLGAGTPILTVSFPEGISADIMRDTGNLLSSHSINEIYMNLLMLLEKKLVIKPQKTAIEKYNAVNIASEYDKSIRGLLN